MVCTGWFLSCFEQIAFFYIILFFCPVCEFSIRHTSFFFSLSFFLFFLSVCCLQFSVSDLLPAILFPGYYLAEFSITRFTTIPSGFKTPFCVSPYLNKIKSWGLRVWWWSGTKSHVADLIENPQTGQKNNIVGRRKKHLRMKKEAICSKKSR